MEALPAKRTEIPHLCPCERREVETFIKTAAQEGVVFDHGLRVSCGGSRACQQLDDLSIPSLNTLMALVCTVQSTVGGPVMLALDAERSTARYLNITVHPHGAGGAVGLVTLNPAGGEGFFCLFT